MAGNFPNLSTSMISKWPQANGDPITRGWYPPYALALMCLSTAVLAARLWSQIKRSTRGLDVDDVTACIAWIFAVLYTASTISGTLKFGFDRHMWDIPVDLYEVAALTEWLSEGAFILSVCFIKISVLCFYRRLEPSCPTAFKRTVWGFIAFTALYSIACLLTQALLCRPTSAYWKVPKPPSTAQGSCASQGTVYALRGTLDILSTLYCILIPLLVLRNLSLSDFQRKMLRTISIASLTVLAVSIARAVFLVRLTHSANGDATWNTFNVFVCSQLECQLSLICSSAPFLHRFASQYPRAPIVHVHEATIQRNSSVMSRVSSSLSGQVKRIPFGRSDSPRIMEISSPRPQSPRIPEWEFEFQTLELPQRIHTTVDEHTYDRYVAGMYGPPAPPKDTRALFEQYRREHGEAV